MKTTLLFKFFLTFSLALLFLVKEARSAGDDCGTADAAVLGTNNVPATTLDTYWYTYTMQGAGKKLVISSTSEESLTVYSGTCDFLSYEENDYEGLQITSLSQGDVVYIKWYTYNDGNFAWNLSEVDLTTGDNCNLAATADVGSNTLPAVDVNEYWYTYTIQAADKKLVVNSSSGEHIQVYTGTCDNLIYATSDYQSLHVTGLSQGEQVFIKWDTDGGGNFVWNLLEEDLEAGDDCSLAEVAVLGSNHLPATNTNSYWFTYTIQGASKKLVIASDIEEFVEVYTNSCDNLSYLDSEDGSIILTDVAQGEQVFIKWSTYGGGDFSWNLSEEDLVEGDNCSLAALAHAGTNYTPGAPRWFTFTTPIDSDITISSVGFTTEDTYLRVYDACDSYPLDASDDYSGLQSQVTLTAVSAGTELLILWDDNYASGPFEWSLTLDEPIDQVITFDPVEGKVFNEEFEINAVSTSGLDVSYILVSGPATLTGNVVKTTGVGEVVVEASQEGNENYNAAVSVKYSFNVAKADQVITIEPIDDQQFEIGSVKVNVTSSSNLEVSISVSGPAELNGDVITFKDYQGEVVITASQAGNENYKEAENAVETFNIIPPAVAATNKSIENSEIQISPNPSSDKVHISYGLKTVYKIKIVDIKGHVVLEVNAGAESTVVNIEGLKPGLYIVNLDSGENQRLIIK